MTKAQAFDMARAKMPDAPTIRVVEESERLYTLHNSQRIKVADLTISSGAFKMCNRPNAPVIQQLQASTLEEFLPAVWNVYSRYSIERAVAQRIYSEVRKKILQGI